MDKAKKSIYLGISFILLGLWAIITGFVLENFMLSYIGIFAPPIGFILVLIEFFQKDIRR